MDRELPIYEISIDEKYAEDGEVLGIEQIAFVKNPAIIIKGVAFSSDRVSKFKFKDDVKMRIAAPVLIPGDIYRNEELENDNHEYYVRFTEEEVENIYNDFIKKLDNNKENFNLEHKPKDTVPSYVYEVLFCDTESKIKYIKEEYNIDIPNKTIFVVSQITNRQYYDKLVEDEQTAYSLEGFLGLKLSNYLIKKEEKMKQKFNLPNGEFQMNGKKYTVFNGDVIKEEENLSDAVVDEVKEEVNEEVKMKKRLAAKRKLSASKMKKRKFADEAEVVEEGELLAIVQEVAEGEQITVVDENSEIVTDFTGELIIEDNIVEVANGEIVSVEAEVAETEVALEEEKEKLEEVKEEVKLSNEEEIKKFIEEKLNEKMEEFTEEISDLKLKLEGLTPVVEEDKEEVTLNKTELSVSKALAFHKAFSK